jgi:DNA-binding MarR family transcriptional regulator
MICLMSPNETSCKSSVPPCLLKRAVIREEFVELTHEPRIAVILAHLLEENLKVPDFDLFLEEEMKPRENRFSSKDHSNFQHGWFYKSARELLEETLLHVTPMTFSRYLKYLVARGWIQTRHKPKNRSNLRVQYRVNLRKLSADLQKKGYTLPGFPPDFSLFEKYKDSDPKEIMERPL